MQGKDKLKARGDILNIEDIPINREEDKSKDMPRDDFMKMLKQLLSPQVLKIFTITALLIASFYMGQLVSQNNILTMAYLSGHIMDVDGPKTCIPSLDINRVPYWNCNATEKIELHNYSALIYAN